MPLIFCWKVDFMKDTNIHSVTWIKEDDENKRSTERLASKKAWYKVITVISIYYLVGGKSGKSKVSSSLFCCTHTRSRVLTRRMRRRNAGREENKNVKVSSGQFRKYGAPMLDTGGTRGSRGTRCTRDTRGAWVQNRKNVWWELVGLKNGPKLTHNGSG